MNDKVMVSMISTDFLEQVKTIIPDENVKLQEPMSRHTSFRTGGEADLLVTVENGEQLAELIPILHEREIPFYLLGFGSNLLVSDAGYHGVMIRLSGQLEQIFIEGECVTAGAGASMARVAKAACEHSLTGLEFASGIPGSIGGGIVMNAGAYGGEMSQVAESVTAMDRNGRIIRLQGSDLEFGYRTSIFKRKSYVVLQVKFRLRNGDREQIRAYMEELAQKRREKQPLEYPSAGSTFKRPEGYFAGKLIMDAGLKGYSIGGAQVSEKHCGFLINRGGATSADIYRLIGEVSRKVEQQSGVVLEPEVILLGDF